MFHEQGARVWITGRDGASLADTARRLGVEALVADVTRGSDWDRVLEKVVQATGRLDVLVNNAGAAVRIRPVTEQSDEDLRASMEVNLLGAMMGCRRVAKQMIEQGSGTILNISSICEDHAWPGWSVYAAAKAGLAQFTRGLHTELRPHGVRVMQVIPSWGATEFASSNPDLAGMPTTQEDIRARCIQPREFGTSLAQLCALPAHLTVPEYRLLPMVQEIIPG